MGLDAEVEMELRDAGLIKFFDKHRPPFTEIATETYAHVCTYVEPTGLPVRRDDLAKALVPALQINEELRQFLAKNHLKQQYQYRRFADLMIDRLWEELTDDPTAADPAE